MDNRPYYYSKGNPQLVFHYNIQDPMHLLIHNRGEWKGVSEPTIIISAVGVQMCPEANMVRVLPLPVSSY